MFRSRFSAKSHQDWRNSTGYGRLYRTRSSATGLYCNCAFLEEQSLIEHRSSLRSVIRHGHLASLLVIVSESLFRSLQSSLGRFVAARPASLVSFAQSLFSMLFTTTQCILVAPRFPPSDLTHSSGSNGSSLPTSPIKSLALLVSYSPASKLLRAIQGGRVVVPEGAVGQ